MRSETRRAAAVPAPGGALRPAEIADAGVFAALAVVIVSVGPFLPRLGAVELLAVVPFAMVGLRNRAPGLRPRPRGNPAWRHAASRTLTAGSARYRQPVAGPRRATGARLKANAALGSTQMRVVHVLLPNPGPRYQDLGWDCCERERNIARQVSHHVGKPGSLGCEVTLARRPEPDGTGDTQAA